MKLYFFFLQSVIIISHLIAVEKQQPRKNSLLHKFIHSENLTTKKENSSIWSMSQQYHQRPKRFITLTENVSLSARASKQYKKIKGLFKKIVTIFYKPSISTKLSSLQKDPLDRS